MRRRASASPLAPLGVGGDGKWAEDRDAIIPTAGAGRSLFVVADMRNPPKNRGNRGNIGTRARFCRVQPSRDPLITRPLHSTEPTCKIKIDREASSARFARCRKVTAGLLSPCIRIAPLRALVETSFREERGGKCRSDSVGPTRRGSRANTSDQPHDRGSLRQDNVPAATRKSRVDANCTPIAAGVKRCHAVLFSASLARAPAYV